MWNVEVECSVSVKVALKGEESCGGSATHARKGRCFHFARIDQGSENCDRNISKSVVGNSTRSYHINRVCVLTQIVDVSLFVSIRV